MLSNSEPAKLCTRCVMSTVVPGIRFDHDGVCQFCHIHDRMERDYPTGAKGALILDRIAEKIRSAGRGRSYDCIVGVSGRDTSYCLYYVKEMMGLRPLAVHLTTDGTRMWPGQSSEGVCGLDVDLHTIIMDWPESRAMTNANIRACVPYDLTDDVGITRRPLPYRRKENVGT